MGELCLINSSDVDIASNGRSYSGDLNDNEIVIYPSNSFWVLHGAIIVNNISAVKSKYIWLPSSVDKLLILPSV